MTETPAPPTPRRIIDAARSLMIEHGLLEVSIAEISQRAGTNVALVSYYFGNREGLMVAIAENDAERATVNLDRLLAADLAPAAKIVAHITGLIETYFQRPYLHRLLQKLLPVGVAEPPGQLELRFAPPAPAP